MTIALLAAKATQPDSDGDARFEASLSYQNEGEKTIELLHVRMLVTDPEGIPLGEAEEDIEELIKSSFVLDVNQITLPVFSTCFPRPKPFDCRSFFQDRHTRAGLREEFFRGILPD